MNLIGLNIFILWKKWEKEKEFAFQSPEKAHELGISGISECAGKNRTETQQIGGKAVEKAVGLPETKTQTGDCLSHAWPSSVGSLSGKGESEDNVLPYDFQKYGLELPVLDPH